MKNKKILAYLTTVLCLCSNISAYAAVPAEQPEEVIVEDSMNGEEYAQEKEDVQFEGSNYEEEEGVLIDENHFPDVHFRNYVSRFDQNHDGKFSEEEISAIHSISLDSDSDDAAETKSVEGISYFHALEHLSLEKSQVSCVDISQNASLRALELGEAVQEIQASRQNQVEEIGIYGNCDLSAMDGTAFQNLKKLHMTHYQGTVALSSFPELTNFIASYCCLENIDFSDNLLLQTIVLDQVSVVQDQLDFGKNPCLVTVIADVTNDSVKSISMAECSNLETAELNGFSAPQYDFSGCEKLHSLSIKACAEQEDTELKINDCVNLEVLSLTNVGISSLNLAKYTKLTGLRLHRTLMKELDVSAVLDLNYLSIISDQMTELDVRPCEKLSVLKIDSDSLTNLQLGEKELLYVMTLKTPDLQEADLSECTNLQRLEVKTEAMGFLECQAGNASVEQTAVLQMNDEGYCDLEALEGFQSERIRSVENAELEGSLLYPDSQKVICTYYLNEEKTQFATFTFQVVKEGVFPSAITQYELKDQNASSLTFCWEAVKGAEGYEVILYDVEKEMEVQAEKILKTNALQCTMDDLQPGGKYRLAIRSFRTENGRTYYSSCENQKDWIVYSIPSRPVLKVSQSGTKLKFTWNSQKMASLSADKGYLIYYSTRKSSGYQRLTLVSDMKESYVCPSNKLKKGKTYYFKMRAYIRNQDKTNTAFSSYSNIVKKTYK